MPRCVRLVLPSGDAGMGPLFPTTTGGCQLIAWRTATCSVVTSLTWNALRGKPISGPSRMHVAPRKGVLSNVVRQPFHTSLSGNLRSREEVTHRFHIS